MKKYPKLKSFSLKQYIRRLYYYIFHGIKMTNRFPNDSILPEFGKGPFVDVIKKGGYIDIISHCYYRNCKRGTIRLIPVKDSHGVMVEFLNEDGIIERRSLCDYRQFYLLPGMYHKENNKNKGD